MLRRFRHLVLLSSICVLAFPACGRPSKLAGHAVGQYEVRGTLLETQCGEGHAAPAALRFFVELRDEEGPLGYWKLPDAPIMDGTLEPDGFVFDDASRVVGVPAQPELGVAGCVVERAEVVTGTFGALGETADDGGNGDAGVGDASVPVDPRASFTGTSTARISAVPGGDCSPLLLPYGGAFPTLPCEIRYSLAGVRLEEPLW
jgi:hypothetical protein